MLLRSLNNFFCELQLLMLLWLNSHFMNVLGGKGLHVTRLLHAPLAPHMFFFFNSKYLFHRCVVTPFNSIYSLGSPQPLILFSFSPTCPAGRVELSQRCESVPIVRALYFTVLRHMLNVCSYTYKFICMYVLATRVCTHYIARCLHMVKITVLVLFKELSVSF